MSYDIWLEIDTGGGELVAVGGDWNYTSNCSPMWRLAGADLAAFDGKPAGDCLPLLTAAIADMRANPDRYAPLDPPNGWGSYASLLPVLDRLAAQFARHPSATVRVCH